MSGTRRMRTAGRLTSGAEKLALLEEQVTTSGFICVCDDEVARGSGEIFEFGDSFGCVIGPTVERSDTGAFAENVGAIDIPISFAHPGKRLFQKSGESIEAGEFVTRVGGQHRAAQRDFELSVGFLLPGGLLGECRKGFAAVGGAALPEKNERLRVFGIELVERIVRELDGAVIFLSRAAEVAHESARAAEAFLRRQILEINLESGSVVVKGAGIVAGHTRDFTERVLGIW